MNINKNDHNFYKRITYLKNEIDYLNFEVTEIYQIKNINRKILFHYKKNNNDISKYIIGQYYFCTKKYDKVIKYYNKINKYLNVQYGLFFSYLFYKNYYKSIYHLLKSGIRIYRIRRYNKKYLIYFILKKMYSKYY